jgi:phosphoglycolate phosphatase-like HAD superfamily hydrolase
MMAKKLLLFDVDGTLILTGGVAVGLMTEVISEVAAISVSWSLTDFVGNTDQNIIRTLLHRNGIGEAGIPDMAESIVKIYLDRLKVEMTKDGVIRVLPGVKQLLPILKQDQRFSLGLLTGNMLTAAQIKLSVDQLFEYFPIGAFGDDALKREQLPPFAIQRAQKYYGHFFNKKDIWIIGDSINDIRCAHSNHLKCLAVASGHTPKSELSAFHPTALVDDLSDTDAVLKIFSSYA